MDKKQEPGGDVKVIGNFNLTAQLPNGRGIQVAGYIYDGEGLASVNDRMDMLQEAIERQRARCEIPELEAKREQCIKALEQLRDVLGTLEDKKTRFGKLSSQETLTYNNHSTNIRNLDEQIKKGDEAIMEAKRKCGMAA